MRSVEVEIGGVYWVKVSGRLVPVKILSRREYPRTGFRGKNLFTGREILLRTGGRIRKKLAPEAVERLREKGLLA